MTCIIRDNRCIHGCSKICYELLSEFIRSSDNLFCCRPKNLRLAITFHDYYIKLNRVTHNIYIEYKPDDTFPVL